MKIIIEELTYLNEEGQYYAHDENYSDAVFAKTPGDALLKFMCYSQRIKWKYEIEIEFPNNFSIDYL